MPKLTRIRIVIGIVTFAFGAQAAFAQISARPDRYPFPSRTTQQDAQGFFFQPIGLGDDYPLVSLNPQKIARDFEVMHKAGVHYFRFAFSWLRIEEKKGKYNWQYWDLIVSLAAQNQIILIPYVCYTPVWANGDPTDGFRKPPRDLKDFARFMKVIASRYKGKILSWELWNEPDNSAYWLSTPGTFAQMLVPAALAVRAVDPRINIVLGGMASGRTAFLEDLLMRGVGKYVDVINVHGYFETWAADKSETYPRYINSVSKFAKDLNPALDIWMAEFGYSDYRISPTKASESSGLALFGYEHTRNYQAMTLWKQIVLGLSTQTLGLAAWYRINDLPDSTAVIGDKNNIHLGILDVYGKPKPVFFALRFYNTLMNTPVRVITPKLEIQKPAVSQSVVFAFQKKDHHVVVVGWLKPPRDLEVKDKSGMAVDKRDELINIRFPVRKLTSVVTYNVFGQKTQTAAYLDADTLKEVHLKGDSVFIADILP